MAQLWAGTVLQGHRPSVNDFNSSIRFDSRMARAGHQRQHGPRHHAGRAGHHRPRGRGGHPGRGLQGILSGFGERDALHRPRRRGHPHLRGGGADQAHRGRRASGCTPAAAATTRWRWTSACTCGMQSAKILRPDSWTWPGALCRPGRGQHLETRHARLHPSAKGPADHLRPPSDGLCADAAAGRRPHPGCRSSG